MVFSSIPFLFFFLPITLALYYLVPQRLRNWALMVVSLIFYAWGEPIYVLLMISTILVTYFCGVLMEKYRTTPKKSRLFLTLSIVFSLGVLFFFKYYDFLARNLSLLGISLPVLGLSLPIGISFYTFQAISYNIDVYRKDTPPQNHLLHYGNYVSLFPQLVAGPILKYRDVADQLDRRLHTTEKFTSGVTKFTVGLCKKVLLANNIGPLFDTVAAQSQGELSVLGAFLGLLAFTFQIYFDFSGYSDMAIGLGRMLGFEFLPNFNYPYISQSITDFWRRWHISLSTWFKEYVYIPLGGNRVGRLKQYRNILIVWCLTGIWHGAAWNFFFWGLYFAVILMFEKAFVLHVLKKVPAFVRHLYTLILVMFGWALFQLNEFSSATGFLSALFGRGDGLYNSDALYLLQSYWPFFIILAIASTPLLSQAFDKLPEKARLVARPILVALGLFFSTAYLVDSSFNPFLYFNF